jgi:hypothetical protein
MEKDERDVSWSVAFAFDVSMCTIAEFDGKKRKIAEN